MTAKKINSVNFHGLPSYYYKKWKRENLLFLVKYVVCSITVEQNLNFILQCAAVEGVVSFGISCDYGEIS